MNPIHQKQEAKLKISPRIYQYYEDILVNAQEFPNNNTDHIKKYAIISTPRCGSTYFCKTLEAIGLGSPMEWYNTVYIKAYLKCAGLTKLEPNIYIDKIIKGTANLENKIFGVNFHISHFSFVQKMGFTLSDLGFDKIYYLERRDQFSQAYSLAKAMKSGFWSRDAEILAGYKDPLEVELTTRDITQATNMLNAQKHTFSTKFRPYTDHIFTYEDILEHGIDKSANKICKDLDIKTRITNDTIPQTTQKHTSTFDEEQKSSLRRKITKAEVQQRKNINIEKELKMSKNINRTYQVTEHKKIADRANNEIWTERISSMLEQAEKYKDIDLNSIKKYAILSTTRTGSNMFSSILQNCGLGNPSTFYNKKWVDLYFKLKGTEYSPKKMDMFIDDLIRGTFNPDNNIFGLKLHVHNIIDWNKRSHPIFNKILFHKIYNTDRHNIVLQAYSKAKAEISGLGTSEIEDRTNLDDIEQPKVSLKDLCHFLRTLVIEKNYYENKIRVTVDREFFYEDFVQPDNMKEYVRLIHEDLGVPFDESQELISKFRRQSNSSQYDDLNALLAQLGLTWIDKP